MNTRRVPPWSPASASSVATSIEPGVGSDAASKVAERMSPSGVYFQASSRALGRPFVSSQARARAFESDDDRLPPRSGSGGTRRSRSEGVVMALGQHREESTGRLRRP